MEERKGELHVSWSAKGGKKSLGARNEHSAAVFSDLLSKVQSDGRVKSRLTLRPSNRL